MSVASYILVDNSKFFDIRSLRSAVGLMSRPYASLLSIHARKFTSRAAHLVWLSLHGVHSSNAAWPCSGSLPVLQVRITGLLPVVNITLWQNGY